MTAESSSNVKFEIGHVLLIDIVGYSKLLINEQRERLEMLNQIARNTAQFRESEASSMLVRLPTGDGMALIFRDTLEAPVQCALEIGKALKNCSEITVRMGIHSGPVSEVRDVNERANIAGAGVNTAQRVMDCGDAGHILLSKRVAEDLGQYRHWQPYLHELGECEVKHGVMLSVVNLYTDEVGNPQTPEKFKARKKGERATKVAPAVSRSIKRTLIAAAVILFITLGVGLFLFANRSRPMESKVASNGPGILANDKSIAVLPFVDLSQAKDQEYFCDGISEEILDALAKIEGLRVVARTSSFSFKGKSADVAEIAQKLNVHNVLEGSLRREGNRIRVTAQLINAHDGFHVWSDTFERELQSVFAVQDEITRSIVDALKIKLAVAPAQRSRPNTQAYDDYLRGLYLSNKSDEESLRQSLTWFKRALEKDPNLARAWTGIAKSWLWLADAYVRPLEAYPKVKDAAMKALAMDEQEAEAHCYLGETKRILDRNLSGEEAELKRALEIDANSATAHLFLALLKSAQGYLDEGVKEIETAEKLDPYSPTIISFAVGIYAAGGRFDDAIVAGKRMLQLDPSYIYFEPVLAEAYRAKGDWPAAAAIYEEAHEQTHSPSGGLAITYAKMGRTDDARRILNQLLEKSRHQYVSGESIAAVYIALGEYDNAFSWLERAFEEHSAPLYSFAFYPDFRPLRSDPRFADLLRRIGIDPGKILAKQTH